MLRNGDQRFGGLTEKSIEHARRVELDALPRRL